MTDRRTGRDRISADACIEGEVKGKKKGKIDGDF